MITKQAIHDFQARHTMVERKKRRASHVIKKKRVIYIRHHSMYPCISTREPV